MSDSSLSKDPHDPNPSVRRRNHRSILSSIVILCIGFTQSSASNADDTLIQRVKVEGVRGWKQHDRMTQNITGTVKYEVLGIFEENKPVVHTRKLLVRYNPNIGSLTTSEKISPKPRIRQVTTDGQNLIYAFDLINGEFVSAEFGNPGKALKQPQGSLSLCMGLLRGPHTLLGVFALSEVVADGSLMIHSAQEIHLQGRTFVQIHGTLHHDYGERCSIVSDLTPFDVTFDPDNGWAIQGYEIQQPGGQHYDVVREYAATPLPGQSLRHVVRDTRMYYAETDRNSETYTCIFEEVSFAPIAPREFTLSAFDLPEPISPAKSELIQE